MPDIHSKSNYLIFFLYTVLLCTYSCDNNLDPIDKEKGLYSIYGALNINAQENYIRVRNLNIPLLSDTTMDLNAHVSLENLDNGQSNILTDSTVEFNGVVTHNFKSKRSIKPLTHYMVAVKRNKDDRVVSARAQTPAISNVSIEPKVGKCTTNFKFTFDRIAAKEAVKLMIQFKYNSQTFNWPLSSLEGPENETAVLKFQPVDVICHLIDISPGQDACERLSSKRFKMSYTHFGPGFLNTATSDSINIPGGTGNLIGINTGTRFFSVLFDDNVEEDEVPIECPSGGLF